jgi:hypothetical protein
MTAIRIRAIIITVIFICSFRASSEDLRRLDIDSYLVLSACETNPEKDCYSDLIKAEDEQMESIYIQCESDQQDVYEFTAALEEKHLREEELRTTGDQ